MNSLPHTARSGKSKITIIVLGSLGVLLMSVGGVLVGVQLQSQRFQNVSSWRMLKFLASVITGVQWGETLAWAAISGLLIALGINNSTVTRARAVAALAAGALVPVGLVLLAHQLNRIWPDTIGPTQVPAMAAVLALYSLGFPCALGRFIRHWFPGDGATADVSMKIKQP